MKKALSTFTAAIFMALAVIGCKPEEPETVPPVLTPGVEELSVPAEGGEFEIVYTLENPVEEGEVSASCPAAGDWISQIDYSSTGTVSFIVSSNEAEESRTTEMTVRYDYPGGEPLSFSVEIEQNGMSGEEPDPDPDPDPDPEEATISLDVNEIGQRYFSVSITPSDKEMSYLVLFKTAEVFDMFPDMDSLISGDMEYFAWMAYMYEMTDAQAIAAATIRGDCPDYLCNAEPDTEYVIYAYGIDTVSLEVLTDVSVQRVTTEPLDEVGFNIVTSVNGHIVTADITPVDYDGWYWAGAWAVDDIDAGMDFAVWCSNTWNSLRMNYETYYGMTVEEIFEEYCAQNQSQWQFELMPETDCRVAVFALDDMAWQCSEPVAADVTTGSTTGSGNVVTINVTDVTSRSASVEFQPSNNDPFAYIVTEAAQFEGMSDDEIIDYCMNRLYAPVRTGRYINTYGKLTPGTEYYAIAYGNYNGDVTTELFLESFTTNDTQVGTLEFSLEYGPWYDLMQLAEADPDTGWDYSAMYYDCLLPVDVPEELADKEFYYMLYTTDAIYGWDDERLYNELYDNGDDYAPNYILADYGLEFVLVGFAVDDNGDWGPIWKSEPFVMSLEGASDPYDYVNR